ncbi:hypothetical protein U9M48_002593, partial [Paspalum notatum var. saurae]
MAEDRSWMYKRVLNGYISAEYLQGVKRFMSHALSRLEGQAEKRIRCPCTKCNNGQLHDKRIVQMHLCNKGFTENYLVWNRHGECESVESEAHESDVAYEAVDHMDEMQTKPLWENCEKHSQLSAVTRLLAIKSNHNISEACFDELLEVIREMLPEDAKLPKSFYRCKKVVEALRMPVQKIDVCKNDCMLYYKEHSKSRKCITCGEHRYVEGAALPENKKGTPHKVLRYLPIIPRLQNLYMSLKTAAQMTYHKDVLESEKRDNEGRRKKLAHPADGEAWKHTDNKYPEFAKKPRNVRLGLSTDGFTPFNHSVAPYSSWPVFIVPYNLPLALCMKSQNIFLNMPLIDELIQLWTEGVDTYDCSKKKNFVMRDALMGTVSDFPAYGMLCGWSTHGKLACPICMEDTKSFWLKFGGKPCWFDCHRCFLEIAHHFWRAKQKFTKDREENDGPLIRRSSREIYDRVMLLPQIQFGTKVQSQKIDGFGVTHNWVKRSIFWELPYWPDVLVRHNLDVIHIEKNVFDNVWNTIMDIPNRTKDNIKPRFDLANICSRNKELRMQQKPTGGWTKPKACYTLDKSQKKAVLRWIKNLKFPDGYASNLTRGVDINGGKIIGMKSPDCHIFMERLLPVAFCDFLPKDIWKCLAELSYFFRQLCAKEIDPEEMKRLEKEVPVLLCKFEQIFPPALVGGLVAYRWMYVFERELHNARKKVRNKARVEGSIVEGYRVEEVSNFMSLYFADHVRTKHTRVPRHDDGGFTASKSSLSIFSVPYRMIGKSTSRNMSREEWQAT